MDKKDIEKRKQALKEKFDNMTKGLNEDAKKSFDSIRDEFEELYSVLENNDSNSIKSLEEKFEEKLSKLENLINEKDAPITLDDLNNIKSELLKLKSHFEGKKNNKNTLLLGLEEKKDTISALKANQSSTEISVKAADLMTTTGNITPQPNPYLPMAEVQQGINRVVTPTQRIMDYVTTGTISRTHYVMVNEVNGEGNAEWVPEGGLKPLIDVDYKTQDEKVKKVAARIKISDEMLNDIPFMEQEIRRLLREKVFRKLRESIYSGTGEDDEIMGLLAYAGQYTQTCLNGKISSPGLAEVLRAAASQIRNMGFDGQLFAFVNPCDWTESSLRKDANGNIISNDEILSGITVVETTEVAVDNFLIGDVSMYQLLIYEEFTIKVGYVEDDFARNIISIIGELRALGIMSDNNIGALVKGQISVVSNLIAKS